MRFVSGREGNSNQVSVRNLGTAVARSSAAGRDLNGASSLREIAARDMLRTVGPETEAEGAVDRPGKGRKKQSR